MFISKSDYNKLQTEIKEKEKEIEALSTVVKNNFDAPKDCVTGKWCSDCVFGIKHRFYSAILSASSIYYTCGKGKCKNFTQRKENE